MTEQIESCHAALDAAHASRERVGLFVPGRIEVLGKHTDYAGGRSLLCTVDRGFTMFAARRADNRVNVIDAGYGEVRTFVMNDAIEIARQDWSAYVAATLRRIARNFPTARRGADIAFASTLPAASGMSSSSALSTAIFLAMSRVNELESHREYATQITSAADLAGYLGTIENGQSFGTLYGDAGVGTLSGSEDHTAILCCKRDTLSQFSFAPVRLEKEIPFPRDLVFALAYSGVAAEKGGAAQDRYNELSLAVREILAIWNGATDNAHVSIADAVASAPDAPERIRALLGHPNKSSLAATRLLERFDQFQMESNEIIPSASAAFECGDLAAFGELVDQSQSGAQNQLRNQIGETTMLQREARRAGAHAASAFGGGFGGSVWALVDQKNAREFVATWQNAYVEAFPEASRNAEFFLSRPGPAVSTM